MSGDTFDENYPSLQGKGLKAHEIRKLEDSIKTKLSQDEYAALGVGEVELLTTFYSNYVVVGHLLDKQVVRDAIVLARIEMIGDGKMWIDAEQLLRELGL